jgi:hypothetical protein
MGDGPVDALAQLNANMESMLDKVELSKHVAVAVASAAPTSSDTTLMHVRFLENKAKVDSLAQFLWKSAQNYALSRRRRNELRQEIFDAPPGDISIASIVTMVVRASWISARSDPTARARLGRGRLLHRRRTALSRTVARQRCARLSASLGGFWLLHGLLARSGGFPGGLVGRQKRFA